MTRRKLSSGTCRLAALCGLVAAVLTAATAGLARAQTAQSFQMPAAGAPAPTAPAVAPQASGPAAAPAPPPSAVLVFPPQPPPRPAVQRGFLNDFGQWWDKSVADFNAKMKEQQSKLNDFNKQSAAATQEAMKNAADAMVRLPTSRVIEIHEICALAGNGAPDCAAAATNACRGKGFITGQPVDIRTAEKCSASLWVSGQTPTSGNCPVETVVLRAACQ